MRAAAALAALLLALPASAERPPLEAEEDIVDSVSLIALGTSFVFGAAVSGVAAIGVGGAGLVAGAVSRQPALYWFALGAVPLLAVAAAQGVAGMTLLLLGRRLMFGGLRGLEQPPASRGPLPGRTQRPPKVRRPPQQAEPPPTWEGDPELARIYRCAQRAREAQPAISDERLDEVCGGHHNDEDGVVRAPQADGRWVIGE